MPERLLEVGRIAKPHGVHGEVVVALTTNRVERVAPGTRLTLRDGRTVSIVASRPHQSRWIVRLEGVDGRSEAEALHGQVLFAEPIEDPDAFWVHDLIGATVVDAATGAEVGVVDAVEENPASDLLVLAGTGGLIPLRFVVGREPGRVVVELPDGLLE